MKTEHHNGCSRVNEVLKLRASTHFQHVDVDFKRRQAVELIPAQRSMSVTCMKH
jgi:hypothetical protein